MRAQYGNLDSPKVDFFASDVWGKVGVAVDGSAFDTDGFPIVAEASAGKVDNNATVNFAQPNGQGRLPGRRRGSNVFVRGGYFREDRDNGKMSTIDGTEEANDTQVDVGERRRAGAAAGSERPAGARLLRLRDVPQQLPRRAGRRTPPRSIGRMTLNQRCRPRVSAAWCSGGGRSARATISSAGLDWRWVDGESQEDGLDPLEPGQTVMLQRAVRRHAAQRRRVRPGRDQAAQQPHGDAQRARRRLAELQRPQPRDQRAVRHADAQQHVCSRIESDTVVSPRVAALYRVTDAISVWGDVGGGFRAPTLNELYRQFRVGTMLTLANEQLGPERLSAARPASR